MNEQALDFQKIHKEFRPRIHRYLSRMVGDYEAEDLTQEVFTRIYRSLDTFRGESKFSTWIYRIATNAALDRLRNPAFNRYEPIDLQDSSDLAEVDEEIQDVFTGKETLTPEQQLFRKQRLACFCGYIKNLPPNYRTVVALSELEELAPGEIAEILGLSLDVVKIRLHRGRARLLQELKSRCNSEDWL